MSIVVRNENESSGIKIAFCGSMGSGKTYASNELRNLVEGDCKVLSIAKPIKEIVQDMGQEGRACHIMVGTIGRQIQESTWIDNLLERVKQYETSGVHNIIVDDVRFSNEATALKEQGFTLVYLNTPWHIRFKRIHARTDDLNAHIEWFAHPSEVAPEQIDRNLFDYIISDQEEVSKVLKSLI